MDAIAPTERHLDQTQIDAYRRNGFTVIEDIVPADRLADLKAAVEAAVEAESVRVPDGELSTYDKIFTQKVNIWSRHPDVKAHTLWERFGQVAAELTGGPMRIWHDQALFKQPGFADNRTPWHHDAVYWPHRDHWRATTIWIALEDATEENGCMSFLPGTHALGPLDPVALDDPADIFANAPHLRQVDPVACPLKAGSCTFHDGLVWHCAGPNRSERPRKAYAIIYMPDGTIYTGANHVLTDTLDLTTGAPLAGDLFPRAG
ncbi:SnoK-like protein [Oceanicola granulosus HTCC2516]|uniref:SnoK-like protein n=1 Tax=Oceanicola granulosus (strain ATCC BAA-861 / DSM 15982 / KCTC 12143 / HTCC2516) TaxID=314256 RepID=Q2CH51_OCEGH|nr:phytanoyl-CoA dioxygenase family protein [Oceanicola granulosus]EAR51960.1 SnoK-like protein [Oceanicola granulosus HTCC2516]